jgi:hypothetical protein
MRFPSSFVLGYRENPVLDHHLVALGIPLSFLRVLPSFYNP